MLEIGTRHYDLSRGPLLMGVLNVTPDSFSDGGKYLDPSSALERALQIQEQGADILDIGAESSRPGAESVSIDEELHRLLPVLEKLHGKIQIPISVDTCKYEVMKEVIGAGAGMINDIRSMGGDKRIPRLLAESGVSIVLMHMRGTPATMQGDVRYKNLREEILQELGKAVREAEVAGVRREKIIVDPGIGFGKSAEANFEIIADVGKYKEALKLPVLIGLSRKSFIQKTIGRSAEETGIAAAALHALAIKNGADILRVHDIIEAKQVIQVTNHVTRP